MKKIFNFSLPFIMAILCGCICGRFVFYIYNDNVGDRLSSKKLYLVSNGRYNSYDEMRENNNVNKYIYYKDDAYYTSVFGITNNKDNIDKIKKIIKGDTHVYEYYIANDQYNIKQSELDEKLEKTDNESEINEIVMDIINLYQDDDGVKLKLSK